MQQRRLRLGDILDDYCPRERRITNHAVVAMIDETVKQTRCTTCDAEHEYKQAKVPAARRRKTGALTAQLVEGGRPAPDARDEIVIPETEQDEQIEQHEESVESEVRLKADTTSEVRLKPETTSEMGEPADSDPGDMESGDAPEQEEGSDEWPVHRRLIRATLPRPEGQAPERKAPDFTFRPAGGKFDSNRNRPRHRGQRPQRDAQGSQPGQGSGSRFGGQRPSGHGPRGAGHGGGPQGQRHGNRPGQQGGGNRPGGGQGRGPRAGGGRKRGR